MRVVAFLFSLLQRDLGIIGPVPSSFFEEQTVRSFRRISTRFCRVPFSAKLWLQPSLSGCNVS